MSNTIEATFDGNVFRPNQLVPLSPNTMVRLTVELLPEKGESASSFLQTARGLKLQGPPDWAANLDSYLYGEERAGGQ